MTEPESSTAQTRPDILLVLVDDMGFSDLGCYGGDIDTPRIDELGRAGTRFTQFYNSPRCSPTRASLLTGLHPHQVGIGILTGDERPEGYAGDLSEACHTVAEVLRDAGYGTYLSGKWHLSADMEHPTSSWPNERGFDRTYGTIEGAGSYFDPVSLHRDGADVSDEAHAQDFFYTDAIAENAAGFIADHVDSRPADPLFLYLAFTAPHWPLHAAADDIARYQGRFDDGWDAARARRTHHLVAEGLLSDELMPSARDAQVPDWGDAEAKGWQARRMEVYAAQVTAMDRATGVVIDALAAAGRLENTLIVFLSDNGACEEEMPPGGDPAFAELPMVPDITRDGRPVRLANDPSVDPGAEDTFTSYGREWANVSNTPFREYKHWVHEGGISTPLIVHWPRGLGRPSRISHTPAQLVDVLPTLIEAGRAEYLSERSGLAVPPPEGVSLLALLRGEPFAHGPLYWEHEGNAAVRAGDFKLVRKHDEPWALHDMSIDRTELVDVAAEHPDLVAELHAAYQEWADRVGVIPRDRILDAYRRRAHVAHIDPVGVADD